jgi:hypothetical protein
MTEATELRLRLTCCYADAEAYETSWQHVRAIGQSGRDEWECGCLVGVTELQNRFDVGGQCSIRLGCSVVLVVSSLSPYRAVEI